MKRTLLEKEIFEKFVRPGEVVEVRILRMFGNSFAWQGWAKGIVSGYFDDHKAFVEAVRNADKTAHNGIYFTLQVIDPRLIGRAFNCLKAADKATTDNDVIAYRWIPIDVDPVRPSGVSASDSELTAALALLDEVADWEMNENDFPAPIKAVSGNGGHLLFRLPDLPPTSENQQFIKNILIRAGEKFDNEFAKVDTKVANPSRIWKLYGTTAKKGDQIPATINREARPHRMAYIDDLGEADGEDYKN